MTIAPTGAIAYARCMIIDIVSDAVCPWCFIGKRRLERALALSPQLDLQIGWRPFQLNPDMPASGMDRQEYLRLKFGDRAGGQMYDAVKAAGAQEGIPFAFEKIARTPNTIAAHRLIRRSATFERQDAMVETLFRYYFVDGRDIGRGDTLIEAASEAGLDAEATRRYLEGEADADIVRAEDAYARQIGINGVPCFIIDRKFAVSGAQAPEIFLEVFEHARKARDSGTGDADIV